MSALISIDHSGIYTTRVMVKCVDISEISNRYFDRYEYISSR